MLVRMLCLDLVCKSSTPILSSGMVPHSMLLGYLHRFWNSPVSLLLSCDELLPVSITVAIKDPPFGLLLVEISKHVPTFAILQVRTLHQRVIYSNFDVVATRSFQQARLPTVKSAPTFEDLTIDDKLTEHQRLIRYAKSTIGLQRCFYFTSFMEFTLTLNGLE